MSEVNTAISEATEALKGTDIAAIKSAMEKLSAESQAMGAALYANTGADAAAGAEGAPADAKPEDDVVDAEIVDEDKDKK